MKAVRTPRRSARLTLEERAELEAAIEEGTRDFPRGDFEEAHAFVLRLVSKSSS